MICNNCGRETRDDSKFCSVCGAEVTHNQTDVQKPVPGKSKRYVVIISIISLLIAVILGVIVWLLISMNKDDKQEQDIYESDNSDSLTGGLKSASKDVLADDKKDTPTQEEGLEDKGSPDAEYITPDDNLYQSSNGNEVLNEAEVSTEYNDNLTFDEKIKIIKDNYYEIQANLDQYRKSGDVDGLVCYHNQDQIKKIIASASVYSETKDLFAGYKAEYYYLDEKVNFVFVYGNSEEYRFYLDINPPYSCIRYIGPDGVVQDFENGKTPTDVNELGIFCNFAQMEVNVTRGLGEE